VREIIMDIVPTNWDICTNAMPHEIIKVFSSSKYIIKTDDKDFGRITLLVNNKKISYRISTYHTVSHFGTFSKYTNNLLCDLEHRDFTINAIAYNPDEDIGLIDPFGGVRSLSAEVIHCIGNPKARFAEDSLRILLALRLAAQFDFVIEKETAEAIHEKKYLLNRVSKYEIQLEFNKILMSKNCGVKILREYSDVIQQFIPLVESMIFCKQYTSHNVYSVWEYTLSALDFELNCDNKYINEHDSDIITRLAIFFHNIGKPFCTYNFTDENGNTQFPNHALISANLTKHILTELKYTNKVVDSIVQLIELHDIKFPIENQKCFVKNLLNKISNKQFERLIKIKLRDIVARSSNYSVEEYNELLEIFDVYNEIKKEALL
jgi:tRNA nucleotidyltransferase (CCA-adding enzyme)